jgi:superfamily II DNA/RNA helicase
MIVDRKTAEHAACGEGAAPPGGLSDVKVQADAVFACVYASDDLSEKEKLRKVRINSIGSLKHDELNRISVDAKGNLTVVMDVDTATAAVADTDTKGDEKTLMKLEELKDPRLKALLQIVMEEKVEKSEEGPLADDTAGLLASKKNVPWPANKPKKFMVFATYPESARKVTETLKGFGVAVIRLQGARKEKDAQLATFRDTNVKVLVVTAGRDCSGLRLPFVTTGIEYHRIADRAVRGQVRGRYHRIGREYNSECITILNEFEATIR